MFNKKSVHLDHALVLTALAILTLTINKLSLVSGIQVDDGD